VALTPSSSHASAPGGAYCLYGGPIPSAILTPSMTRYSGPSSSIDILGAYALPSANVASRGDVVTGTYPLIHFMHLDYLKAFVDRMSISIQQIRQPITVNSAKGPISSNYVYPSCVVRLADKDFVANLVVIPLDVFDAILRID
jgi:hypothetical protein